MRQETVNKKWILPEVPDLSQLQKQTGCSLMLTRLMYLRGFRTPQQMRDFLDPMHQRVPDAFLMKDMTKAVDRILQVIAQDEKIRVIGDYDQDGIASTAILLTALRTLGARADFRIPHRVREGYGIKPQHVENAKADGVSLLITCDNGISAAEAARTAEALSVDLLITDHHQPPEVLPEAVAILNPHQPDCPYPNKDLAGAGVCLKLSEALWQKQYGTTREMPPILYGFAAMGTVCDIMKLTGENRKITLTGLEALNRTKTAGLAALKEESGVRGLLDVYTLGFVIGPSMNAAGRLDTAEKAVRLLITDDPLEAVRLAKELRQLNIRRQEMTEAAIEAVLPQIPDPVPPVLCLKTDCHESLLGIVAGKIRDRVHRPVYMMSEGAEPGMLKGSARSIASYPMHEKLKEVAEHLEQYGGHAMAAGFSVKEENANAFCRALTAHWEPSEEDLLPTLRIDFPIDLSYINPVLVGEIERMAPFGKGNPKPLFASRDVTLAGIQVIGKNRQTLRFRFRRGRQEFTGIQFRRAEQTLETLYTRFGRRFEQAFEQRGEGLTVQIVYTPQMNEYAGSRFLQLVIEDIR